MFIVRRSMQTMMRNVMPLMQLKMGDYKDNHSPTCMFDNCAKLLSHMLTPLLHMEMLSRQPLYA